MLALIRTITVCLLPNQKAPCFSSWISELQLKHYPSSSLIWHLSAIITESLATSKLKLTISKTKQKKKNCNLLASYFSLWCPVSKLQLNRYVAVGSGTNQDASALFLLMTLRFWATAEWPLVVVLRTVRDRNEYGPQNTHTLNGAELEKIRSRSRIWRMNWSHFSIWVWVWVH